MCYSTVKSHGWSSPKSRVRLHFSSLGKASAQAWELLVLGPWQQRFFRVRSGFFRKFRLFLWENWEERHECCCLLLPLVNLEFLGAGWAQCSPNQPLRICRKQMTCFKKASSLGGSTKLSSFKSILLNQVSSNHQHKKKNLIFLWKTLWENHPTSEGFYPSSCTFPRPWWWTLVRLLML